VLAHEHGVKLTECHGLRLTGVAPPVVTVQVSVVYQSHVGCNGFDHTLLVDMDAALQGMADLMSARHQRPHHRYRRVFIGRQAGQGINDEQYVHNGTPGPMEMPAWVIFYGAPIP